MKNYLIICLLYFILLNNVFGQNILEDIFPPQEVQQIQKTLQEIVRLTRPSEMPRRIELLDYVLTKITKDNMSELWAYLENEIAFSFYQNPFGLRAANLELAIEHSQLALQVYTREAFPQDWAMTQNNLAIIYNDRIRGERAANLEQAIEHYQLALQVRTRQAFPQDWAATQNNLAITYRNRIYGERAANLELAIEHSQLALQVYTREAFPQDWAMIQNNLASAYRFRIRGERVDNVERAIELYQSALQVYTREAFPQNWAMIQNNLAYAYSDRIHGKKAANLELAIEHCQLALQVYTREAFPQNWASTQNNLAIAYSDRIRGKRADNLEQAIEHYQLALQVFTREAFPEKWATTQNNLANAYNDRIRGERADNLEQAIEHCQLALQVFTREAFPQNWASTQNSLANAYNDRIRGERADNLERAIEHYHLALQVRTREAFPQDWAMTQNNLANAYSDHIRGERADNLEQAIKHYQLALQVYTRIAFPQDWVATQNNLALAYSDRIRGERADNLEQAIEHYQLALQVYTREAFPEKWAMIQNNLAFAYRNRIRGEGADNLERAIEHCQLALQVRTREAFPEKWAMTHINLANAYNDRIRGERADNLEQAIKLYQLALQVYTSNAFPQDWAMTQNNLANAYNNRIRGERADNLEQAIEHYQLALQVRTKEAFPYDFIQTSINLGAAYLKKYNWSDACTIYSTVEEVGADILALTAGEQEQAKSLALFQKAFSNHAYALAKNDQFQTALNTLEKGKTRSLNQALLFQNIRSAPFNPELKKKFINLQQEINNLQQQVKQTSDQMIVDYTSLAPELRHRQTEMSNLLQAIQQQLPIETIENWDIKSVIEKCQKANTALVAINVTPVGAILLVSSPNKNDITPIFIEELNSDSLKQITWRDRAQKSSSLSWTEILPEGEEDWTRWCDKQSRILSKIGNWLWPKLDQFLQQEKIEKVILMPQNELFLYPLHATPYVPLNTNEKNPIYPLERYTIIFTPSLRLYDQLSTNPNLELRNKQALFVEDPDGNLGFSFAGQKLLSDQLSKKKLTPVLLHKSEITSESVLARMKEAVLIHYYGHGYFNWNDPEASGIKMYSQNNRTQILTMDKIGQSLIRNRSSLVILSACETGMTDVLHDYWQDQYIGLPAGFLRSGANTVVGSLWTVENRATCILLSRFYQELLSSKHEICPAEALRRAQLWLLRATPKEIAEIEVKFLDIESGLSELKLGQATTYYSHPAYWAAFYVVGNGFARVE